MKKILGITMLIFSVFFYITDVSAQRGCCSWHGGVCGCSPSGRTECCDGTLSPSCACSAPEPVKKPNPKPKPKPAPVPNPAPKQPSNNVKPLVENNPDTKPTTEELYRTAKEEIETLKKELAREQKQSDDRKEHGNNLEQQVEIFKKQLEEEKQRTGSDELDLTLQLLASLGANFYQYSKRKLSKN